MIQVYQVKVTNSDDLVALDVSTSSRLRNFRAT
jgi:hypothetical protein